MHVHLIYYLQATRTAADTCKNALDGTSVRGKQIRVRLATHSAALRVHNLTPHCTNEYLHEAFSRFGEVGLLISDD